MEHFYLNIQGYFNFQLLYSEIVKKLSPGSHFVEVGSWLGMSACYMGVEIVNSGKDIKFDCVDTWEGSAELENEPEVINGTLYQNFLKNIDPLKHIINPIKHSSVEASKLYEDNSLDAVYIDADHSREAIEQDLKHWYPKIKVGGIFAGHDYDHPAIKESLDEFLPDKDYEVKNCSSWVHIKKEKRMLKHQINDAGKHLEEADPRPEFLAMEKYCRGLGFDLGPGTNRLSPTVLCSDWYPHKGVDLVWNCAPDPKEDGKRYFVPFPFTENTFDFVFASHVIEDFPPEIIQYVFDEMLRMIKPGGYFVILVPDIEGGRYPKIDERFTAESPEVISGERQIGELAGNPSHHIDFGITWLHKLKNESKYPTEIMQQDTIEHSTMTLDFVLRKI